MSTSTFHDAWRRLAQVDSSNGVRLMRITQLDQGNRYLAQGVEFDSGGAATAVGGETFTVTNLAEPADSPGNLPLGSDVLALDVEGRWVTFVRMTANSAGFAARVTACLGAAAYSVREQSLTAQGAMQDKSGAIDVTAKNLAELSLGSGAAVDVGAIVLVCAYADSGSPATLRYFFDHPAYAKYL